MISSFFSLNRRRNHPFDPRLPLLLSIIIIISSSSSTASSIILSTNNTEVIFKDDTSPSFQVRMIEDGEISRFWLDGEMGEISLYNTSATPHVLMQSFGAPNPCNVKEQNATHVVMSFALSPFNAALTFSTDLYPNSGAVHSSLGMEGFECPNSDSSSVCSFAIHTEMTVSASVDALSVGLMKGNSGKVEGVTFKTNGNLFRVVFDSNVEYSMIASEEGDNKQEGESCDWTRAVSTQPKIKQYTAPVTARVQSVYDLTPPSDLQCDNGVISFQTRGLVMDHSTLSTVPVSELVFMGIMAAAGACCCLCTVVGIFAYIMHRQAIAHREEDLARYIELHTVAGNSDSDETETDTSEDTEEERVEERISRITTAAPLARDGDMDDTGWGWGGDDVMFGEMTEEEEETVEEGTKQLTHTTSGIVVETDGWDV